MSSSDYSRTRWYTLNLPATKVPEQFWIALSFNPHRTKGIHLGLDANVPREFVICLTFNPTSTRGVCVSHDAEDASLVGLPGKKTGSFTGGDWLLRADVDQLKDDQ